MLTRVLGSICPRVKNSPSVWKGVNYKPPWGQKLFHSYIYRDLNQSLRQRTPLNEYIKVDDAIWVISQNWNPSTAEPELFASILMEARQRGPNVLDMAFRLIGIASKKCEK